MKQAEVKPGDIVQIDPDKTSNKAFSECLMVVTAVNDTSVIGYVHGIGRHGFSGRKAYYQSMHGEYKNTGGRVKWI